MITDPGVCREVLQGQAYVDDQQLDVRYRTHQLYTINPIDFGRWTLERIHWRGNECVLDMGCARGDLLREMAHRCPGWRRLFGFDLSPGMVVQAQSMAVGLAIHLFVGDAQSLPVPDASFDVVMARHMLYHVPDIHRAVSEAARALRPGGKFLATTNSAHTMPELRAMREQAMARFPAMVSKPRLDSRYSLENATSYLEPYFARLEVHCLPGTLRFPSGEPLVAYFASMRALVMQADHTEDEWQAVLEFVRSWAEAIVVKEGFLDVTKVTGAIVAFKEL
jgi:SAM-dependent methyltransferase